MRQVTGECCMYSTHPSPYCLKKLHVISATVHYVFPKWRQNFLRCFNNKCFQKDHQIVWSPPIHLMKSINYGDYNLNLVFEKMTIISVIASFIAK
jgi:hypothetical protein